MIRKLAILIILAVCVFYRERILFEAKALFQTASEQHAEDPKKRQKEITQEQLQKLEELEK